MIQNAFGQDVNGKAELFQDGSYNFRARLQGLHLTTLNNTAATSFNATGQTETQYNTSGTTVAAVALALPTVTVPGQTVSFASKSAVTAVTVTGTVLVGAALTSMSALQVVSYRAVDNAGTFIRIS